MPIMRRAKILLSPAQLRHALNLRSGVQIISAIVHYDPLRIEVILFSNDFPAHTEAEESIIVPLHTVQHVEAPATTPLTPMLATSTWKHPNGGPGQRPWTCRKGHVLAAEGEYDYDNIEWYRPGVKPGYGCKQCKREAVVANPRHATAEENLPPAGWAELLDRYRRDWQSLPVVNGGTLNWDQVHYARYCYFGTRPGNVHRDIDTIARDLGVTTQSVRRILKFKAWRCSCSPCQRWTIDAVMQFL